MRASRRVSLAVAHALAFGIVAMPALAQVQVSTLISHNGFEDCWSWALTKANFLVQLESLIDGATFCVAPSSGTVTGGTYMACNTPACPGGASGCPVTVHSGIWNGDFGTGAFSGPGSADDVSVPISYTVFGVPGSCTVTISSIVLSYSANYALQPDGNSGDYMAALNQAQVAVTSYGTGGSDPVCTEAASQVGPQAVTQAEATASTLLFDQFDASTVGESVCPLVP